MPAEPGNRESQSETPGSEGPANPTPETDNADPLALANSRAKTGFDRYVISYGAWVLRWRWPVLIFCLLVAVAAGSGGRFLSFTSDYRVFFGEENPQLQAYEALQRTYSKDDNISFVMKPDNGQVFSPEFLTALRDLTEAAWQVPYSTRVDSITNFQHSFAEGDDLTVQDLVGRNLELNPAEIENIRQVALNEPLLVDKVISANAQTTSVNVTVTLPQKAETESAEVMAFARDMAEKFRAENPDVTLVMTGVVPLNNAFNESAQNDLSFLVPLMYGVLLLVMIVLVRSASGTLTALLVIALSVVVAMGVGGYMGIKLTPPSAIVPNVVLTIAVADSIHLLVTMLREMRRGASKHAAIIESLRVNFGPVFLTSLTTVIGFLSLNFSDAPPFHDLGNMSSVGVAAAWLFSILLLPAMISLLPVKVKANQGSQDRVAGMDMLADFVIENRKPLLITMTLIVVGLGAMIPRIELNDQFVRYFDNSLEFRADTDFATEHLSGVYQVNWSLPAADSGGISDPDYLAKSDAFSNWLKEQRGVAHVQTLTDTFKRLNMNMHGDDPEQYKLPEDRELAAQYLLLFELSLPYGLDLNNQINVDKSAMRVIVTTDDISTNQLRTLESSAEAWLATNFPEGQTEASSPFVMFAYISERNIIGMLTGTVIAFVLISMSLMFALRNVRLGIISLVPNLIPIVMAFGIWSIFVGEVGLASSVVTATSLGIIVDATVHFLSKYQRGRRDRNEDVAGAVRYAFSTVGTALWVTSAILIAGFGVLAFSTFRINGDMGMLTAIAIAVALIADFLLLPTLLLTVDKGRKTAGLSEAEIAPKAAE